MDRLGRGCSRAMMGAGLQLAFAVFFTLLIGSGAQEAPQFDSPSYTADVNQNTLIDSPVLTVNCTHSGPVGFNIIAFSPNISFLSIGQLNGEVILSLNASTLEIGEYVVSLVCFDQVDSSLQDISLLTVSRIEENQFNPFFLHNSPLTVSISESRDIIANPFAVDVDAMDNDIGSFGSITYAINPTIAMFAINGETGVISLQSSLDYEESEAYQFIVSAANPIVPETGLIRSAELVVLVQVTNINDIAPVFTFPIYQTTVSEAFIPADSFLVVQCTDADSSIDEISYRITDAMAGPFNITTATGELFLTQELDYESLTSYSFGVSCTDIGAVQFTSVASVTVTVGPVNEFIPTAVYTGSSSQFIFEGQAIGSVVLSGSVFTTSDADAGPDGNVYFSINSQDSGAQNLNIDATTGDIYVTNRIDIDRSGEPFSFIQLAVTACDVQPPQSNCPINFVNIVFFIFQAADEPPIFSQDTYQESLPESTLSGTTVVTASCSDADVGIGAFSSIQFLDPPQNVLNTFSLNPTNGMILTSSSLDYEIYQSYTFRLRCIDEENTEDTATVQISVLAENDNPPRFDQEVYDFNITQTAPLGPIGSVSASDLDIGFGSEFNYSIQQNDYFSVTTMGEIELTASLQPVSVDSRIVLSVLATDGMFTDNATVIVTVTPGNLNAPEFVSGSTLIELSELIGVGTTITTVSCNDSDAGVNAIIFYSIISGNMDGDFSINSSSGDITVRNSLVLPQNDTAGIFLLLVECRDRGLPELFDEINVLVRVERVTIGLPDIANNSLTAFVSEDAAINDIVTTIEANGFDTSHLRFRLENETIPGAFLIDPSMGIVTVAAALDRESFNVYQMTVILAEVSQILGPEQSDQAQLTIFIRDINDNSPSCDTSRHVAIIPESTPVNETVLQLACTDLDVNENGELIYSLSDNYGVLMISNTTGEVSLVNSISDATPNTIVTMVTISDLGATPMVATYQITIFITQTNRFSPMFLNLPETISLSEATSIQELVFTVRANDLDRGSNGQVSVHISSGQSSNETFIIFPNTGDMYLTNKLNFHQTPVYNLTIDASDGEFITSEALTIMVEDANEYTPECESTFLTVSILEDLSPSQTIPIALTCSDADEGSNGAILYSIVDGNINDTFEIYNNGSIQFLTMLNFEEVSDYNLLVTVSDSGNLPLSTEVMVNIRVLAVNEFSPTFCQLIYNATVPEDSQVGSTILQVPATDRDTSPDGIIQYTIEGLSEPLFGISNNGTIQLLGNLNRENNAFHSFFVIASDGDIPLRSASVLIEITVSDVDDNPPSYLQAFYYTTLNLTTQVSSPVLQVNCTDPDSGVNAEVYYSLVNSTDSRYFEIISDIGLVVVKENLDLSRVYTFDVSCSSPETSDFSDIASVSVEALIRNSITFLPTSLYELDIPEDLIVVSVLININASSETGSPLLYTLLDQGTPFAVDAITGILYLVAPLDYETRTSYALRVEAGDEGNPPNIAESVVQIFVENINDEQPQILTTPSTLELLEGVAGPIIVGYYDCQDADASPQNQTVFSIVSGSDGGLFTISSSGVLQLVGELDYEAMQAHTLLLDCQDGGQPVRTASTTVHITVIPVNEHSPVFTMSEYVIEISENVALNAQVSIPIQAEDADLSPHGDITYSISNGPLTISTNTGALVLSQSLDYELISMYMLSVTASDGGDPILNSTVSLKVVVTDINDNSPQLSASLYIGSIEETAIPGDEVSVDNPIVCNDIDSSVNGEIELQIVDGNTDSIFNIQVNAPHIITVANALNIGSYSLTIECSDRGIVPLTSQATVIVSVLSINEFGPVFDNFTYVFEVLESTSVGAEVGVIHAVDEDLGEHGIITYTLDNATDIPFVLDSSTGIIRVTQSLDFETQQHMYVVEASATDSTTQRDTTTIIIQLLDENDNSPIFSQNNYYASISENAVPTTLVILVICADRDDMAAGIPVEYDIIQSNVPFSVDGGQILVSGGLDLEQVPMYMLDIQCTDSGGLSVQTSLTVHLEPYNNFVPLFTGNLPYMVELTENQPLGLSIFQVTALDDDKVLYNDIKFSLTSGNSDGIFAIDPTSGIINIIQTIDREERSSFMLIIEARNVIPPNDTSGSPSLFSSASLAITVLDLNDNVPTITPEQLTVFISQSNTVIVEFVCSDPDLDRNGETTLSITSENTAGSFRLYDNGTLQATQFLGVDVVVEVTCSDNGIPPLTTTATIIVSPTSMNDHQPTYSQASYTLMVSDDIPVGQDIECYEATDSDGSETPDGIIQYSLVMISMGMSRFSINADTGCVFASIALDANFQNEYEYNLTATDFGNPPLTGIVTLVVIVTGAASNAPSFVGEPFTRIISEGVESNTVVFTLFCSDADNDNLTYNIADENDGDIFAVGLISGILTIAPNQRLDYERSTSHTLSIQCIDPFGLSDTAQAYVTVTPINEFTPTFQDTAASIPEHSIVGTPIIQLEWMDGDDGNDGDVTFRIVSGDAENVFVITNSGQLLVAGVLDRESTNLYSLGIEINDLSSDVNFRRSSVGNVNITLLDINDNSPQFVENVYAFGPLEGNEVPGFVVGNVSCIDADREVNAEISYLQLPTESSTISLYRINISSGVITLSGDIESRNTYTAMFIVQCQDSGVVPLSSSATVLVSVIEVNRQAPVFVNSTYQVSVFEEITTNMSLLTLLATDTDAGAGGEVRYYLADGSNTQFSIDESTGDLFLVGLLDYELQQNYSLTILAIDGEDNSPVRITSTVLVSVEVVAVNDHGPVCFNTLYSVTINETTTGALVNLQCSDADLGIDGMLIYSITNTDDAAFIVNTQGVVELSAPIPPNSSAEMYLVHVSISDSGSPARTSDVEIEFIYSFNDPSPPVFGQPQYEFMLPELIPVGQIIATVNATDPDPGLQGKLTYSLVGTTGFNIDSSNGLIYVSKPLDYELVTLEQFQVIARDNDPVSPLSATAMVNVNVQNENDTTPECPLRFYDIDIFSNSKVGKVIVDLDCSDPDANPLEFEIIGEKKRDANSFSVNETTGQVYIAGPLLPSTTNVFSVLVSGSSGEITTVMVSVPVKLFNTDPPTFQQEEYFFVVPEDTSLLSIIGSVTATDNDTDSRDITYTLLYQGNVNFFVHPTTGNILLTSSLDYETETTYLLTIQAEDVGNFDGTNQLSTTVNVTVMVRNTNDNAPELDSPVYATFVSTSSGADDALVDIKCTDLDASPFGSPALTIVGVAIDALNGSLQLLDNSNESGSGSLTPLNPATDLFQLTTVNASEGLWRLQLLQSIDLPGSFRIGISCIDDGNRSSNGDIYVFVPEERSPQFSEVLYEWRISENTLTTAGFFLLDVTTFNSTPVQYEISSGNDDRAFYIHPSTGVVSLLRELDYETQATYVLIITVTDLAMKESNSLLIVRVLDMQDELPRYDSSMTTFRVHQNTQPGVPIGVVMCEDADSSAILDMDLLIPSSLFSIDQYGIIRVSTPFDSTSVHLLSISCYNILKSQLATTTNVIIETTFSNTRAPVFEFDKYAFAVYENATLFSVIGSVQAIDRDVGSYGEVNYEITGGECGVFYINSTTGAISLLSSLDYESATMYQFTVEGNDCGDLQNVECTNRMSSTTLVTIFVLDVNDIAPSFVELLYVQDIFTNHSILSPVLNVECLESEQRGMITYSLGVDEDNFVIQRDGTILLVKRQFEQSFKTFEVTCSDGGNPSLSSSVSVTVIINSASSESFLPVFQNSHYQVSIREDVSVFTTLIQLHADIDTMETSVVYSIQSGNDDNYFYINSVTGDLVLIESLLGAGIFLHNLVIRASTAIPTAFFSFTAVVVDITSTQSDPPSFFTPFHLASVTENAQLFTPVGRVRCSTQNAIYEVTSAGNSASLFNITSNGVIIVAGLVDYEQQTVHMLTVTCRDGITDSISASTIVRIEVMPQNEYTPIFSQSQYNFSIAENNYGLVVGQVQAQDQDVGIQGEIVYELIRSSDSTLVLLEPSSGEIIVASDLDYERQSSLIFVVTARDMAGKQTVVVVTINTTNVNDEFPTIDPSTTVVTIPLDSPPGYPLFSYRCIDADGSATNITILSGNEQGYFNLNDINQLIWTNNTGGLSSDLVVFLTVQCFDVDAPMQMVSSRAAITIQQEVQIRPPVFSEDVYNTSIPETIQVGSLILMLAASGPNSEIEFSIYNPPNGYPFTVDADGAVRLSLSLVHEVINLYLFTVQVIDTVTGAFDLSLVQVGVEDVEDVPPIVIPTLHTIILPENFGTGLSVATYACRDGDTGAIDDVIFQITHGNTNTTFSVTDAGSVVLAEVLDLEAIASFNLTVTCLDRRDARLSANATLIVLVTGINEYAPQFTQQLYNFTVSEDALAGMLVGSVRATDRDEGLDGVIHYEVVGGSGETYFSVISTGDIHTTSRPLNASENQSLELTISAIDSGFLSATGLVVLYVADTNEAPIVLIDPIAIVAAFPPPSVTILEFTCYDVDVGKNANLTLDISYNPSNLNIYLGLSIGMKSITSSVIMNSTLPIGTHELGLTCMDDGDPSLHSNATVVIRVEGSNTSPVFTHGTVVVSVREDTPVTTLITTVNATDAETNVLYEITSGNGLGTFSIDPSTGSVYVALSLDYEITSDYVINIFAHDLSPISPLLDSVKVVVLIENTNDVSPQLSPPGTQVITLSENTSPPQDIFTYTCTDQDGGSISFSLNSPGIPFGLASQSQSVSTLQLMLPLDYEVQATFSLIIVCTDSPIQSGDTSRQASATVLIYVRPENNYTPEFISPASFAVREDSSIGQVIGAVQATDGDNRTQVTYLTLSPTDVFSIDQFSGSITIRQRLDFETVPTYTLTIQASDNDFTEGLQPRIMTTQVTIQVTDANDHFPLCSAHVINVTLPTGFYSFISLTNVTCSDADSGMNGILSYSINDTSLFVTPNGSFVIDNTTGEFGFTGAIMMPDTIVIDGLVADNGVDVQLSTIVAIVVQITVSDADVPRFTPSLFSVMIPENTPSQTTIFDGALLRDALHNPIESSVRFSLHPNTLYLNTFVINTVTGDLILTSSSTVDFDEGIREYELLVQATLEDYMAIAVVNVMLTDVNDNPPIFFQSTYVGSVHENVADGTSVLQVQATDIDTAQIRYSLENTPSFSVNSVTGRVTTVGILDRETLLVTSFLIMATDSGSPPLTGTALVTVTILDENDNPPQFQSSLYTLTISSQSTPGVLTTLLVSDNDSNSMANFRIMSTNPVVTELFTVESPSGNLIQLSTITPDLYASEYSFTVEVTDGIYTDTTAVIIRVAAVTFTTILFEENTLGDVLNLPNFLRQQQFNIPFNATYNIVDGNDIGDFAIAYPSGTLVIQNALNRELISQYDLIIEITDDAMVMESINLTIAVIVSDQNDNIPSFSDIIYLFSISEGFYTTPTFVGKVFATDLDQEGTVNSIIQYSLIGPPSSILINEATGEVFVQGLLDREMYTTGLDINVRARDYGQPVPLASYSVISLDVIDVNDNDPRFTPFDIIKFTVFIEEGTQPGVHLDSISGILPSGSSVTLSAFEYMDPDSSSTIESSLILINGENKYKLENVDGDPNRQVLVATSPFGQSDTGTVLQLVLRDEPENVEQSPVRKNVTISIVSVITSPTSATSVPTTPPSGTSSSFEAATVALIVISIVLLIIIVLLAVIAAFFYWRSRGTKSSLIVDRTSPLNDAEVIAFSPAFALQSQGEPNDEANSDEEEIVKVPLTFSQMDPLSEYDRDTHLAEAAAAGHGATPDEDYFHHPDYPLQGPVRCYNLSQDYIDLPHIDSSQMSTQSQGIHEVSTQF